jgi:hypothetical protein
VFSKANIREAFEPYLVVKLFTDIVPKAYYAPDVNAGSQRQEADAEVNFEFQRQVFGTAQLPLYVILEPQLDDTVTVIGVYDEGRINNETAFAEFLRQTK